MLEIISMLDHKIHQVMLIFPLAGTVPQFREQVDVAMVTSEILAPLTYQLKFRLPFNCNRVFFFVEVPVMVWLIPRTWQLAPICAHPLRVDAIKSFEFGFMYTRVPFCVQVPRTATALVGVFVM